MNQTNEWIKKESPTPKKEESFEKQGNTEHTKKQFYPKHKKPYFKNKNFQQKGESMGIQKEGGSAMKVILLGGLNEVGKNCMCIEFGNDMIIIDVGLQFPEEGMLGIDYVIPDLSYPEQRKKNIRAIVITHGHLDHIGGLQHALPRLGFPPIYATRLTKGLIEKRLDEAKILQKTKLVEVNPDDFRHITLGNFQLKWFRVNHSIPDSCGIHITTPAGKMIHTGDFKFDFTPSDNLPCDFQSLVKFGKEGVDALFADSTNATRPDFCPSEKVIGDNIGRVIREAKGRVIIATFASSIGRIQQIIEHAVKNGRKIFVSGKSMVDNLEIAQTLGFVHIPKSHIRKLGPQINDYPPHEILVLTTGSQGEPLAALSRIARDEHPHVKIDFSDTIAFSSSPIPGNERSFYAIVDELHRKGATVVTKVDIDIHASGHAYQGDLKLMHSLVKPKNIIPIHGEYFMRVSHKKMVQDDLGYDPKNVILIENGNILEIQNGQIRKSKEKVETDLVFIDGKKPESKGTKILDERTRMSEGGIVIVSLDLHSKSRSLVRDPRITSYGFFDNETLHKEMVYEAKKAFENAYHHFGEKIKDLNVKESMEKHLRAVLLKKIDCEPTIMTLTNLV